ncbi:hypothetical protein HDV06_002045 [Boothiomyces sp. JEL0866]|nr:hypothetical protein HDV06_002045 [Boothiomyces sp. JEL0866]
MSETNSGIYLLLGVFALFLLPTILIVGYYYIKDILYPKADPDHQHNDPIEIDIQIHPDPKKLISKSTSTLHMADADQNTSETAKVETVEVVSVQ